MRVLPKRTPRGLRRSEKRHEHYKRSRLSGQGRPDCSPCRQPPTACKPSDRTRHGTTHVANTPTSRGYRMCQTGGDRFCGRIAPPDGMSSSTHRQVAGLRQYAIASALIGWPGPNQNHLAARSSALHHFGASIVFYLITTGYFQIPHGHGAHHSPSRRNRSRRYHDTGSAACPSFGAVAGNPAKAMRDRMKVPCRAPLPRLPRRSTARFGETNNLTLPGYPAPLGRHRPLAQGFYQQHERGGAKIGHKAVRWQSGIAEHLEIVVRAGSRSGEIPLGMIVKWIRQGWLGMPTRVDSNNWLIGAAAYSAQRP